MEFMVCFCCFDINLRGKVTKKSLKTPTNGAFLFADMFEISLNLTNFVAIKTLRDA